MMKTILLSVLIFTTCNLYAQDTTKIKSVAGDVLNMLQNNKAEEVYVLFDAKMQSAMQPNTLTSIWKSITNQHGPLKEVKDTWVETVQTTYKVVTQECQFGETLLDFKLTFDENGKIAGMFFTPPSKKKE